jgi:hypothetical protein
MQTVLMAWLLQEKHHGIAIPNSTVLFPWEADIVSMTQAAFSHEFEIKVSRGDFLKDAKKRKHVSMSMYPFRYNLTPNYFWYATCEGFDIEPPVHAGWVIVKKTHSWYKIDVKKEAPRLHTNKVPREKVETVARLLSFRLMNEYLAQMNGVTEATK